MSRAHLLAAATLLVAIPRAAAAAEKVAVLVLATSDQNADLADNVTEVVIARVAAQGGLEIAGKEEFRARLGVESERRTQSCVDDTGCLARAAVSLGVRRILTGNVGARGRQFLFSLSLIDLESGRPATRVFRLVEGRVEDLIRAVAEATDELFRPRDEPGRIQIDSAPRGARVSIDNAYLGVTPLLSPTLLPGPHAVRVEADRRFPWRSKVEVRPGQDLQIKLTPENLPARRAWPARAAYGSTAACAAALAAGGVLGALSQVQPSGSTRFEAMQDLDQKRRFALAANVSFGTAIALGAASIYFFVRYRDDIFGRSERDDEPP
jgi:hypothetical protein